MDEIEQLGAETADLGRALEETRAVTAAFQAQMAQLRGTVDGTTRDLGKLDGGFSRGLKRAIDGIVLDGDRLSDALRGVAMSMSQTVYNAAMKPVTDHLGGLMDSAINGLVGGALPFAKGSAFSQGQVMPFAKGGVVSGPTTFPIRGGTGLMGEAGPEAIMPLSRTADGRLGVAAQGGRSVHVTMHITTPDAQSFQRSQAQIAAQLSRALGAGDRNR